MGIMNVRTNAKFGPVLYPCALFSVADLIDSLHMKMARNNLKICPRHHVV